MTTQPITIRQKFTVNVPIETVWGFLRDPELFTSCIPGVEQIEAIDERTFRAMVTVKITLVTARFRITVEITEEQPPACLMSMIRGDDEKTKSGLEMMNTLTLTPSINGETEVAYRIDAKLSGKLAALGGGIAVKLKAAQMGREFAQEVKRNLER
jgi:carbon monoxide dehydrogenase subunit G